MKENYAHIGIVLDRSGSMSNVVSDTIGGFNTFLDGQKKAPGEATVTLVQFDGLYELVYKARPIGEAPALTTETFVPRGSTALLDAIGRTINETGEFLNGLADSDKPSKVIFVVLTDGFENASHQFTSQKISEMIAHQRDAYQWEFVFLAANQDAITSAAHIGIGAANAMSYAANATGVNAAFSSLSHNAVAMRSGLVKSMAFTDDDRLKQRKAGVKPEWSKQPSGK